MSGAQPNATNPPRDTRNGGRSGSQAPTVNGRVGPQGRGHGPVSAGLNNKRVPPVRSSGYDGASDSPAAVPPPPPGLRQDGPPLANGGPIATAPAVVSRTASNISFPDGVLQAPPPRDLIFGSMPPNVMGSPQGGTPPEQPPRQSGGQAGSQHAPPAGALQGEGRLEGPVPGPPPPQQQQQPPPSQPQQRQPPAMPQRANSASSGVSNGSGGRRGGAGGGPASGQGGPQGPQRRNSGAAPAPQHMPQMQQMAQMSHGSMAPQYAYVNMPPGMMAAYPGMPYQQAGYYYAANTVRPQMGYNAGAYGQGQPGMYAAAPTHAMYGVPPQQAQQQQMPSQQQQPQGMPQQGMPAGQRPMGGPRSQGGYAGAPYPGRSDSVGSHRSSAGPPSVADATPPQHMAPAPAPTQQAPQDQRLQQEPRQGPPMGGGPSRPPMQGPNGRGSQGLPVTFPQQQARSGGAPKPVTIPPVVRQPKRVLKIVDPTTNQGLDISSVKTEVNKMQEKAIKDGRKMGAASADGPPLMTAAPAGPPPGLGGVPGAVPGGSAAPLGSRAGSGTSSASGAQEVQERKQLPVPPKKIIAIVSPKEAAAAAAAAKAAAAAAAPTKPADAEPEPVKAPAAEPVVAPSTGVEPAKQPEAPAKEVEAPVAVPEAEPEVAPPAVPAQQPAAEEATRAEDPAAPVDVPHSAFEPAAAVAPEPSAKFDADAPLDNGESAAEEATPEPSHDARSLAIADSKGSADARQAAESAQRRIDIAAEATLRHAEEEKAAQADEHVEVQAPETSAESAPVEHPPAPETPLQSETAGKQAEPEKLAEIEPEAAEQPEEARANEVSTDVSEVAAAASAMAAQSAAAAEAQPEPSAPAPADDAEEAAPLEAPPQPRPAADVAPPEAAAPAVTAAAEPALSAKAKRKAMMAKAESRGDGGDMMEVYKEKKPEEPAAAEPAKAPAPAPAAKPAPPAAKVTREPSVSDNWESEDQPTLPAQAAKRQDGGMSADGRKQYSRDFMLMFQQTSVEHPPDLVDPEVRPGQHNLREFGGLLNNLSPTAPMVLRMMAANRAVPGGMPPMDPRGPPGRGPPPGMGGRGMGGPPDRWQHAPMPGPGGMAGPGGRGARGPPGPPPGSINADKWARGNAVPGGPTGRGPSLHKTRDRYEVGKLRTDDPDEEKKQKEFKSMLNKLTPNNQEKLLQKFLAVGITQAKTLRNLIDQIFDKALVETTFTAMYAQFCSELNKNLPEFEDPDSEDGKMLTFRRILLNKCQEEFEAGDEAIKAVDAREKREAERRAAGEVDEDEEDAGGDAADAAKESTPEKPGKENQAAEREEGELSPAPEAKPIETPQQAKRRAKMEEAKKAEEDLKARRRMLGNIQFIGELFKEKMLTEKIMHECIVKLLGNLDSPRQEDVECLIKLINTIGSQLDENRADASRQRMRIYFERITQLSRSPKLERRVQYALLNLRDLRENNWVARREVEGPKKIDDVHEDAKRERDMAARMGSGAMRGGPPRGGDRGRRDGDYGMAPRGQMGMRMDPVPPRNVDRVDGPIRAMSRTPSQEFLGPSGASLRPGGRPTSQQQPPTDSRGALSQRRSMPASRAQGSSLAPQPAPPAAPAPAAASKAAPAATSAAPAAPEKQQALTEAEMRERAQGILTELLGISGRTQPSLDGAVDNLKELAPRVPDMATMLEEWVNRALQVRGGADWSAIAQFLVRVTKDVKLVAPTDAERGLRAVLNEMSTMKEDLPELPRHTGTLLGALVAEGVVPLQRAAAQIADARPADGDPEFDLGLVDSGDALPVLGGLAAEVVRVKGYEAARDMIDAAGISLEAFMPERVRSDPSRAKAEISRHGLQVLAPPVDVEAGIRDRLQAGTPPVEVSAWLEEVAHSMAGQPSFVRAVLLGSLGGLLPNPAEPAVATSPAEIEARLAPCGHMLLKWAAETQNSRNAAAQRAAVYAVQEFWQRAGSPPELMLNLSKALMVVQFLHRENFVKWQDDVSDLSPAKQAATSQLHSWLSELEEQERSYEDDED